jgi:hypothetical protein
MFSASPPKADIRRAGWDVRCVPQADMRHCTRDGAVLNRRFLESRLAYRIQELAYGGLSRETLGRLRAMAKQYATKDAAERKARPLHRPIAGTKLIREYQGVEHCVTVRADDFEYLGRPYKSLSSVAREITGTKWNGLVFFGLKRHPG